jgi:MFS family permease
MWWVQCPDQCLFNHNKLQSAVATALPTIVNHFDGEEFVWIGSAYSLAGTAFLPFAGHLANIFGRRPILLASLLLFALGSALCGGAQSMAMLIGGRSKFFLPFFSDSLGWS